MADRENSSEDTESPDFTSGTGRLSFAKRETEKSLSQG